jgi:hypothetical protein
MDNLGGFSEDEKKLQEDFDDFYMDVYEDIKKFVFSRAEVVLKPVLMYCPQVRSGGGVPCMPQHRRSHARQRLHQVGKHRFVPEPLSTLFRYADEEGASKCVQALHGRFFASILLTPEFSPVTDFREARCRQVTPLCAPQLMRFCRCALRCPLQGTALTCSA